MPLSPVRSLTIALANETDGPGGVEVLITQLAEELRARGHRIVPILPMPKECWLPEALRERGFEPESVRFEGPLGVRAAADLRSILVARRVDVLHSHEFVMSVLGTVACGALRIPHVISMHGNQTMTDAARRRVALRWAFRHSDAVVAVSGDTHRHLVDTLGISPESIYTIPNGVPIRHGDPAPVRAEFGLSSDDVMLLTVGNLSVRKGHAVLIRALARLRNEGLDARWKLVVAGRGDQYEPLGDLVRAESLEDHVVLAGHRDDIPSLQEAADIFVMPSLWEGLPLAVLEAMFAGNPVVASETSGIPEAIVHDRDGLLVPPGEDGALAAALRPLLTDREARQLLGEAGRSRALRDFTIERMASDYEKLYRRRIPALRCA